MMGTLLFLSFLAGGTQADTILIRDLPLVEARATPRPGAPLVVLWTGDGDWAGFVRGVTRELNDSGLSVVAVKSRSWLRNAPKKDPDLAGRDLSRVLQAYLQAWGADSVVLIGYSRGADLLPFAVSRLPADQRTRITLLALISPAVNANFEFHWIDIISNKRRDSDLEVLPEIRKLAGMRAICLYGTNDGSAVCPMIRQDRLQTTARPSGHRMEDPQGIARLILKSWRGQ